MSGGGFITDRRLTGREAISITSLVGELMKLDEKSHRCEPGEHRRKVPERVISDRAFERAAAIFRAASDESRLRLLQRLSEGEWCVSELAEAANVGLSTVSQQLRLLRAEHLVRRRRAGKHVFYELADDHVASLLRTALEHATETKGTDDDAQDS